MGLHQHTYRVVDGARIEGTWRPAFIKNGDYYLTDLLIYADGQVDCWGLVDFEEFCAKVRSGWVATTFTPGARASAHQVASWHMTDPISAVTADDLIAEVRDEIDRLRGEPTSEDRCLAALRRYLAEPGPGRLAELGEAYLAVPEHLRMYLLGDMDSKDIPLRQLLTPVGKPLMGLLPGPRSDYIVTEAGKQAALAYFAEWTRRAEPQERARWTDPERPPGQRDVVGFASGIRVMGVSPDNQWLAPASPHPVTVDGVQWPTALHAYWAASTQDPELITAISSCDPATGLHHLMRDTPRRDRWAETRLAVMARVLRLKFDQHPELAAKLTATSDSLLVGYYLMGSDFWDNQGQNWIGRLLELIRAELIATSPAPGTDSAVCPCR